MRDGDLRVDAGGIESGVAEELLDDSGVGSIFVHVGRGTVAQEVVGPGLFDPGCFDCFGDPLAEVAGVICLADKFGPKLAKTCGNLSNQRKLDET